MNDNPQFVMNECLIVNNDKIDARKRNAKIDLLFIDLKCQES